VEYVNNGLWVQKFQGGGLCIIRLIWQYSYYTVHGQPATIITFSSASYWWSTSPGFPCTCICSCFRWWRHRWFCCKVAEPKRRGTRVRAWLRVIKNWSHVARISDIFGWNLSTKNVDIYCSWYTLIFWFLWLYFGCVKLHNDSLEYSFKFFNIPSESSKFFYYILAYGNFCLCKPRI